MISGEIEGAARRRTLHIRDPHRIRLPSTLELRAKLVNESEILFRVR